MWFEDIVIGSTRVLGTHAFSEDEIIAFAKKYDPQPFHIDREAAKESIFGGIIASGWHTACTWMRLGIEARQREAAEGYALQRAGVSPGFENLRWLRPVRPGVALTYTSTVVETVELKSRPTLGLVKTKNEARDAQGKLYMSFTGKGFVQRRPTD